MIWPVIQGKTRLIINKRVFSIGIKLEELGKVPAFKQIYATTFFAFIKRSNKFFTGPLSQWAFESDLDHTF